MGKRKWIAILVVVGVLASILGTTAVLANDPTTQEDSTWAPRETWGHGMWGMHGGHMGFFNSVIEPTIEGELEPGKYCFGYQDEAENWGMYGHHNGMVGHIALEEVAEVLGLTPEELFERINEGQTIEQIALDRGISIEQVIEAALTPHAEMISALVEDGYFNQEEADGMLEQARLRVEQLLTTQWFGFSNGYCSPRGTDVEPDTTYDARPGRGFGQRGCW